MNNISLLLSLSRSALHKYAAVPQPYCATRIVFAHAAACVLCLVSSGHLLRCISWTAYSLRPSPWVHNTKQTNHLLLSPLIPGHLADDTVAMCLPVCLSRCTANSMGVKPFFFRFHFHFYHRAWAVEILTNLCWMNALKFTNLHETENRTGT